MDKRLSWPGWLTCSGWFTHNSGHPSAASCQPETDVLPLCHATNCNALCQLKYWRINTAVETSMGWDGNMVEMALAF